MGVTTVFSSLTVSFDKKAARDHLERLWLEFWGWVSEYHVLKMAKRGMSHKQGSLEGLHYP